MRILVIGSGGREHALVWKLKQSKMLDKIFCAPGNAGIALDADCIDIAATDLKGLLDFAIKEKIDFTIVGPEVPLVQGIVDLFEANGKRIFGPNQKAAELEGSKAFAKRFMEKYEIPTADFTIFTDFNKARQFVNNHQGPMVVKADGLAAGKGAIVCPDKEKAVSALEQIMGQKVFGEAGNKVVIEECMTGEEISIFSLTDGEHLVHMLPSQDHKRISNDDKGPNTGGMGAYTPTPQIEPRLFQNIIDTIVEPTVKGMALEGRPYRGLLYTGIMLTPQGPKVLEYNCRFGDPETQAVLMLAESDLLEAMVATVEGRLGEIRWTNSNKAAVCVVIASGGYPGKYEKDRPIIGLDYTFEPGTYVFHAGTKNVGGVFKTNGGRVLNVVSVDETIKSAIDKVYRGVRKITFDCATYRTDIAKKALNY
ncbi:phosphoribosylamine--glycine ligase [candidate division KSB1 bacterium]|nr:phosphoribosylamine--glycine ligase [candidate division KSB1 bacterium]